jgi:hypothetical protein
MPEIHEHHDKQHIITIKPPSIIVPANGPKISLAIGNDLDGQDRTDRFNKIG